MVELVFLVCITLIWLSSLLTVNSQHGITQFQPKWQYSLSEIVLSYLVLMDTEGRHSSITPYTSGLCGAAIRVSRHHNGRSISSTWWWSHHKKKRFICLHNARNERGAAWSIATATFLLSFTASGASYFLPCTPSFYYSEGMHLSRGRYLNHFLHPS